MRTPSSSRRIPSSSPRTPSSFPQPLSSSPSRRGSSTLQKLQNSSIPGTDEQRYKPIVKIISGTRSYADQNRLFRQGRYYNPGNIITNARGGSSSHNFGIAWDIGIYTETEGYIPNGPLYDEVAKAVLTGSLEWGGNRTRFVDKPHYQLKLIEPIQVVRQRFEAGEKYIIPHIAKAIMV